MSTLVHQIRVLEESKLDAVRKVCGNSFGVQLTVSVSSLKEAIRSLIPMNGAIWMRDNHEEDLNLSKGKCCMDVADVDV
jgi:hypothetical protein